MSGVLSFFVAGDPVPKGSLKGFPFRRKTGGIGVALTNANARTKPWEALVAVTATSEMKDRALYEGPVRIDLTFVLSRLKGHFGKKGLKPNAPPCPINKIDIDKLSRLVLDALTGIAWVDDGQVIELHAAKHYVDPVVFTKPGVHVRVKDKTLAGFVGVTAR